MTNQVLIFFFSILNISTVIYVFFRWGLKQLEIFFEKSFGQNDNLHINEIIMKDMKVLKDILNNKLFSLEWGYFT